MAPNNNLSRTFPTMAIQYVLQSTDQLNRVLSSPPESSVRSTIVNATSSNSVPSPREVTVAEHTTPQQDQEQVTNTLVPGAPLLGSSSANGMSERTVPEQTAVQNNETTRPGVSGLVFFPFAFNNIPGTSEVFHCHTDQGSLGMTSATGATETTGLLPAGHGDESQSKDTGSSATCQPKSLAMSSSAPAVRTDFNSTTASQCPPPAELAASLFTECAIQAAHQAARNVLEDLKRASQEDTTDTTALLLLAEIAWLKQQIEPRNWRRNIASGNQGPHTNITADSLLDMAHGTVEGTTAVDEFELAEGPWNPGVSKYMDHRSRLSRENLSSMIAMVDACYIYEIENWPESSGEYETADVSDSGEDFRIQDVSARGDGCPSDDETIPDSSSGEEDAFYTPRQSPSKRKLSVEDSDSDSESDSDADYEPVASKNGKNLASDLTQLEMAGTTNSHPQHPNRLGLHRETRGETSAQGFLNSLHEGTETRKGLEDKGKGKAIQRNQPNQSFGEDEYPRPSTSFRSRTGKPQQTAGFSAPSNEEVKSKPAEPVEKDFNKRQALAEKIPFGTTRSGKIQRQPTNFPDSYATSSSSAAKRSKPTER